MTRTSTTGSTRRHQPARRSGRAQPQLPVPDDVSARDQGQVRRLDRHPAPLQRPGVRPARSGHRAHRGQRGDVPQRLADAVHVEPAAVERAAVRGRRHGRPERLRHRQLRHGARWLGLRGVRPELNPSASTSPTRRAAPTTTAWARSASASPISSTRRFATSYVTGAHNLKSGPHHHPRQRHRQHDQPRRRRRRPADLVHVHERRPDLDDAVREPQQRRAPRPRPGALRAGSVDAAPPDAEPRPAPRLDEPVARRRRTIRPTRSSRPTARRRATACRTGRTSVLASERPTTCSATAGRRLKGGINRYVAGGIDRRGRAVRPDGQLQHDAQLDRRQRQLLSRLRPEEPGARRTCAHAAATSAAPTTTRAWRTFTDNTTVANPDFTNGWFKRGYNWRATRGHRAAA